MSEFDIINTYADHLLYFTDAETASASKAAIGKRATELVYDLFSEIADDRGEIVMENYSNFSNGISNTRNVEIVGVHYIAGAMADSVILCDSLYDSLIGNYKDGIYAYAVGEMPSGYFAIRDVVKFTKEYEEDGVVYLLKNSVTEELSFVDELLLILGQVFLYVGLGFALFASLMLANFIGTSITYKKQEIGILRAIGSRSADIFRIFFAESFVIAMINYVLSLISTGLLVFFINKILREDAGLLITIISFGIRQIIVLLAISLLVAFVATFLPVRKIAAMKPIDAIKNIK